MSVSCYLVTKYFAGRCDAELEHNGEVFWVIYAHKAGKRKECQLFRNMSAGRVFLFVCVSKYFAQFIAEFAASEC